jgi:hypothetical protein
MQIKNRVSILEESLAVVQRFIMELSYDPFFPNLDISREMKTE